MVVRRIITGISACAFLTAGVGLPVSLRVDTADDSFACAGHGCGCRTAEMCRTQCCCFKPKRAPNCHEAETASSAPSHGAPSPDGSHVGLLLRSSDCTGITAHWLSVGVEFPPPAVTPNPGPHAYAGRSIVRSDHTRAQSGLEPVAPPPRA